MKTNRLFLDDFQVECLKEALEDYWLTWENPYDEETESLSQLSKEIESLLKRDEMSGISRNTLRLRDYLLFIGTKIIKWVRQ